MKLLVLSLCLAVAYAAPVASPDGDDDATVKKVHHFVGSPSFVHHQVSPAVGFSQFVHPQTAVFKSGGSHVVSGTAGTIGAIGFVPGAVTFSGKTDDDDDDVVHTRVVSTPVFHHAIGQQQHGAVAYQHAAPAVAAVHHTGSVVSGQIAAPAVATYHTGSPVVSTYNAAQYVASVPAVAATHALAAVPAVATAHAVAAPAVQVAATPTFAVAHATPVKYEAEIEVSEPVVTVHQQAIPSAVTYQSEQVVNLGTKEIDVPVQTQHVHVPVEKRIHYGVEKYVAGSTTAIHKPKLSAPAIEAPRVFAEKNIQGAPEVTVTRSEVTVEEKSPNYVHAKYDAGVVVEKAPDAVETFDVPTPVEVPQPVAVAQPYAVAVPHPVKIKSEVNPVLNVDVHHHETQNVVTPIEYSAHHVATPVVHAAAAAPAVVAPAFHAAPDSPAVQYSAVEQVGVATQGHALTGHVVATPAVVTQRHFGVASPVAVAYEAQGGAHTADAATQGHAVTGHFAATPSVVFQGHFGAASPAAVAYGVQGEAHNAAVATHGYVAAPQAVLTHGHVGVASPVAVAYGAHGAVTGHHAVGAVTGQHAVFTGHHQIGAATGGAQTVTYGAHVPAHGQVFTHQPIQFEASDNTVVAQDHVSAPVAVVPEN